MTTDEASEPTQEPSDNDQGGTAGDDQGGTAGDEQAEADGDEQAEADDEAGATAEPEGPGEPSQERLDGLQEDIDRVRARVEDEPGGADVGVPETETDRQFVEPGEQEPVDDTIAPPG